MTAQPLPCRYEGEGEFRAVGRFAGQADEAYVIGEVYLLAPVEHRSEVSHRHEFAFVREAWLNLPEDLAERFPNEDALRKHALIKAGFCTVEERVCATAAEAARTRDWAKRDNAYAFVIARGPVVLIHRAESQKKSAMGKERFQASKDGVLRVLSEMLGTEPGDLRKAAA